MSTNTEGIYMSDFSGNTIFGNLKQFSKLNEKKTINTELFIQACKDVTTLLDRLGAQFSIAKKDMLGNVKRIEERFNTNKSQYTTLNSIMEEDSKDSPKGHTSAIVGILWLKRGLEFLCAILDGLLKAYEKKVIDDNLRPIILEAYEKTLKPYHGMVSKFLFSVSMFMDLLSIHLVDGCPTIFFRLLYPLNFCLMVSQLQILISQYLVTSFPVDSRYSLTLFSYCISKHVF
uniref:Glycolipid transfer protein domain-containing protein n=1 Tax=Biomphalaria glabrata TaxID=6526 RepID=A0A2C9LZD5_BIOGL